MKVVSAIGAIGALCFAQSVIAVPHHRKAYPSTPGTPSITPSFTPPATPSWTPTWTPSCTPSSTPSSTESIPTWTPPIPGPTGSDPWPSFPWPTPTGGPTGTGGIPGPTGTGGIPWPTGTGGSRPPVMPIACASEGGPPYGRPCGSERGAPRVPAYPVFRRSHARHFRPLEVE